MSTEPRQSEVLCFPFRARSLALKPAHWALHRLTSRVITVVPQFTLRSELSEKHRDKNYSLKFYGLVCYSAVSGCTYPGFCYTRKNNYKRSGPAEATRPEEGDKGGDPCSLEGLADSKTLY